MSDLHAPTMTNPSLDIALTDTERQVISAVLGCGCCVEPDEISELVGDSCRPDEDGYVDHDYSQRCARNRTAVLERLITDKVTLAITHARLNGHVTA